ELERAILDHDPALLPSGGAPLRLTASAGSAPEPARTVADPPASLPAPREEPSADPGHREQKRVSVLFVRTETPAGVTAPEVVEQVLAEARAVVRDRARRAGGRALGQLGPLTLCVFGADRVREDDARRAVRAGGELAGHGTPGFRLRVAVATGEALVADGATDDEPPGVTGRLFQTGLDLLFAATPNTVRVCDMTRELCGERFGLVPATEASGGHDIAVARLDPPQAPDARTEPPFVHRDRELHQLAWWAREVRRSGRPHLVTVLGEAGIGKSRLVREFRRRLAEEGGPRCLVGAARGLAPEDPYVSLAEVVRSYTGVVDGDSEVGRDRGLREAVTGLTGPGRVADRLTEGLRRLLGRPEGQACRAVPSQGDDTVFAAWRGFVEELAAREPLVVVLEDLERADDALLAFAGGLVEAVGELPLLVVVTARPELADRPAYWAAGRRDTTVLALEPLPRPATHALLAALLPEPRDARAAEVHATLAEKAGGNPLFAVEYARALAPRPGEDGPRPGARVPVPAVVHSVVSARIDTLPEAEKSLLYDASLFEGGFLDQELTALGDGDESRVRAGLEVRRRAGGSPHPPGCGSDARR
ncbi:ATP-binding protein, partial [Streptomyces sp. NPDC002920]